LIYHGTTAFMEAFIKGSYSLCHLDAQSTCGVESLLDCKDEAAFSCIALSGDILIIG